VEPFATLFELVQQARQAEIITVIDAPSQQKRTVGQMLIIPQDGEAVGTLVDQAFTKQVKDMVVDTNWQKPMLIELDYSGGYRLFWDRLGTRTSVLVLGAGHISQPLVEVLTLVGYDVTVVDDRPEFANLSRFPKAAQVICNSFGEALAELDIAGYAAVIIVTRGHRYDLDCLRAVIGYTLPYIGMIGSQRRVGSIIDMLTHEGMPAADLARLRAPIGIDIGAQTPAEIALSIAAEVMAVIRGGSFLPLSGKRRCSHG
jgi:xanthine dehydrogenase accessory factor